LPALSAGTLLLTEIVFRLLTFSLFQ
jgi:hypothetical protein